MKPPVGVECFVRYKGQMRSGRVGESHFYFNDGNAGSCAPVDSIEEFYYREGKGMHPPENHRCRALHQGKWRIGTSDGEIFTFEDGHWGVDSKVEIDSIDAFEELDAQKYRPSWHHGD